MRIRNSKRESWNSASSEDKEDEAGDRNNDNDNNDRNFYARTVDFSGAVRGFADSPDSNGDEEYYNKKNDRNDDASSLSHTPIVANRKGSIVKKHGKAINKVSWTGLSSDDDSYIDSYTRRQSGSMNHASFASTGTFEQDSSILESVEKMEMTIRDLQKEVGRSSIIRKSRMIRTSLILKDVDFQTIEFDGADSHYPTDCYSLIALNGPCGGKWPWKKLKFFLFGLMVFSFQVSFLVMMLLSRMRQNASDIEIDNPISHFLQFIPSNSKEVIRVSQVITLMTYTLFPDASLMDVFRTYQYWPSFSNATKDDPVYCMILSCILRGFQGYLATMAVFLVVITTPSVVDIILNFTALSFISSLDDEAFALVKSGVFGPELRKEVERIEDATLPACFTPKNTLRLYWKVMGSTGVVLFSLLFCVIGFQNSPGWWVTPNLRVEFLKETGLSRYSGCYSINRNSKFTNRFAYTNAQFTDGEDVNAFAYCTDSRRWNFFAEFDEDLDPCDAETKELARSTETDFFDIAKSFEELWFYPLSTTTVGLFFFQESKIEDLNCEMFLGNGVCDEPFNIPGYNYDNGDCCAATCNDPFCGRGDGYTDVFGNTNKSISGNGYPNCIDPDMQPVTIYLNDIVSSRDSQFDVNRNHACDLVFSRGKEEWRAVPPENPMLWLQCNGVYVLTVHIEESMKNHAETVWVEDGANCRMGITNFTSVAPGGKNTDKYSFYCDDPIWFVNYTVLHGSDDSIETNQKEIFTEHSSQNYRTSFRIIPRCYFAKLRDFVDIDSIYLTSNPSYEVINWLLDGAAKCEDELFTELFALATIVLGMNGNVTTLDNDNPQCRWAWITCTNLGFVDGIDLPNSLLEGEIPEEFVILSDLKRLNLYDNQVTSIPREIGQFTALTSLWLHDNMITSIPSEIGLVEKLENFWLNDNQIVHVPSEIGMLRNLRDLDLGANDLISIPSEIGLLTNLKALWLGENQLKSIPTEIGLLVDLEFFWSDDNRISSFPSEFGSLSNMEAINLNQNNITYIPTEIGLMSNLRILQLDDNKITSIPSEIGLLTNLRHLHLNNNQIASIPSEIALLTNLNELILKNNGLGGNAIPREVAYLCSSGPKIRCQVEDDSIGTLDPNPFV